MAQLQAYTRLIIMHKLIPVLLFIAFGFNAFPQGTSINLNTDSYVLMQRLDVKYSKIIPVEYTVDKPFNRGDVAKFAESILLSNLRFSKVEKAQLQYLLDENSEWLDSLHSRTRRPLFKVLYTEPASFFAISSKKKGLWDIRFNPLLDITVGGESGGGGRFLFNRSVGLEVRADIKQVFSFYFNATGNDERPPLYASQVITRGLFPYQSGTYSFQNVPGASYYKNYSSKVFGFTDGIDYFDARGYVSAHILKHINLSFGRDKFFIGDGMRSLILSDYAAPYLFLKFDVSLWRFKYENIFAQLTGQYDRGTDQLLPIKYMAVHHLTFEATHWLTAGIFETVMFQRSQFEVSYLNPIIFYKAVEASLGNPDKVSIGADFKINATYHLQFYGQVLLNEFNVAHFFSHDGWWANKWAIQAGAKYINILPGLDGQFEFNVVRPFTYTANGTDNFTNYNQPLAHPLGANFYELIFNLRYQPLPKWAFNIKFFVAKVGTDTLINGVMSNYGANVLLPNGAGATDFITQQFNNHLLQGATGTISYFEFLTTYQPWHNINVDASILYRSESTVKSLNNPITPGNSFMFKLGIRINLARRTYEF